MFRTLLFGLTVSAVLCPAVADDASPPVVVVVTADGKPAANAKVWAYEYTGGEKASPEPTPLVTDAAGKVSVPAVGHAKRRSRQLFARDSAGRIGWSWLSAPWEDGDPRGEVTVVLVGTAPRNGRLLDPQGKTLAGATIAPLAYYAEDRSRREPNGPPSSIDLPEWEQRRLAVKTDADGRFKLSAPQAGYSVFYRVTADGFGESKWSASTGVELVTRLARPGSVAITITGIDPALLKGREWRIGEADGTPVRAKGIRPSRWKGGTFDGTGKLAIPEVVPGKYELTIWSRGAVPGVFEKPKPFEVVTGKATAVTAKFGPAAKVTGKITDRDGKGLAKVPVRVNVTDSQGPDAREYLQVETDADGNFVAHGSAGWYMPWLQNAPEGYALPAPMAAQGRLVEPAKVEVGQSHAFPAIALLKAVTFRGQVVTADGKPAAGAMVSTGSFTFQGRGGKLYADKDGNFAIPNLPPDDAVAPRVRLGRAVNVPETFDLEKTKQPVTIEVSEANAAGFKGQVTDTKGKPIAGAKVRLQHDIQLVGRKARYSTRGVTATTTTDAEGKFSFAGLWPKDAYSILVSAAGYSEVEGKRIVGAAGEVQEFGVVKLTRANLAVSGTVVGTDGKPIAGVELFTVDGPARASTTSASDGSFILSGFHDSAAFLHARKDGYRLAAVPVFPARSERVTVTLAKADAPPGPQPTITTDHRAALEKFTRHALSLVLENHAQFGYGGSAIADLARIDLDAAKQWRDQVKKQTSGKTDFTRHIEQAIRKKTLLDTAKADIDEAAAIIGALKPDDGFTEAMRVGRQMLAVDKAKAARLAEEAVVKARQCEIPRRIWSLAEAGDLALRAGSAGGRKVLAEAAELADKLTPDAGSHNSLAVGYVAAYTAPHDWPKAEKMLNRLKEPNDFNRYLGDAAARVARSDLALAKKLLDRFRPDNSYYPQTARLRVAFAVARDKPDEAIRLVESVKEGMYRAQGLLRLAAIFAPANRPRAVKMIDAAFDLMDRDPIAFRGWSNFGGRAALAALGAVRAQEIGYPDVASLVARALAMRATRQDAWSPENHDEQTVNLAAVLALVDPAAARHLLATIAGPDEFVARAVSQRRDWLFALALADPARATALADRLIERAKTSRGGRNGLSETGLVELCSVLTAPDRLKDLTGWGSLPREIGDDD